MSLSKTLKREPEVAFSKHAQPLWVRVLKYLVLGALIYFLREASGFGSHW
jgi:hypothetical protein